MFRRLAISLCILTLCLAVSPLILSAASAPEGVNEVLEEMGELEENFEGEKWKEAFESVEKIEREINEILAQTQLKDDPLLESLAAVRKYVVAQNEDRLEGQYIRFQKHFFQLINMFDFDMHPVLTMIQKYVIEESTEAYEKKDYEDVISEMREAGNLIDHAKPIFMEKGIPEQELDDFKSKVIELIMVGKKKQYAEMGTLLDIVKEQYSSFISRYKQS